MKNFFIIFALALTILSCKKEDEAPVCTASDFVGTWKIQTGSKVCILSDATTLTITDAGSGKLKAVYTGTNITSQFDPWTLTNCTATGKVFDTDFGIDIASTATISGTTLTVKNTGKLFSVSGYNCTEIFTK